MKRTSISRKLFRMYTMLFGVFFLVSVIAAVAFMSMSIHKSIIQTQMMMTDTISQAIEGYFDDMNEFSMTLLNSNEFKNAVINELPLSLDDNVLQNKAILTIYSVAYQMFEKGYRLGVATKSGVYIWLADQIIVGAVEGHVSRYDDYDGYGKPVLLPLEGNDYLARVEGGADSIYLEEETISLSRSINLHNQFIAPQAYLEVHVERGEFEQYVETLLSGSGIDHMRLTLVTKQGRALYGDGVIPDLKEGTWSKHDGDMAMVRQIFNGDLTVCYSIPTSVYYQRLIAFVVAAVVFSAVMLLLVILMTYRASKSMTRPIAAMSNQLEQLDLTGRTPFHKVDTEIYELDLMAQTVANMNEKLGDTLQDMVTARTAEMQSHLMALQSQMQPHFLYNTLAVIGSLSEQGNPEAVTRMCSDLSKMLRYVSAKADNGVTVYEEVCFLNNYVAIMKERFPRSQVHIDIPMELMSCKIPKLILQPLCENSYKYAEKPDAEIWLEGTVTDTCWRVQVRDSGPGFTTEKIQEILARCRDVMHDGRALSTSIDGMGLVNIYARLALYYREDFVFEIDPENGVTIGGRRV